MHHVASISGLVFSLGTGFSGSELVATAAGAEFSNPLLQTRWFLRELGAYDGYLAFTVDTLFTVTFGLVRFGIGSALLYATLTQVSTRTAWTAALRSPHVLITGEDALVPEGLAPR